MSYPSNLYNHTRNTPTIPCVICNTALYQNTSSFILCLECNSVTDLSPNSPKLIQLDISSLEHFPPDIQSEQVGVLFSVSGLLGLSDDVYLLRPPVEVVSKLLTYWNKASLDIRGFILDAIERTLERPRMYVFLPAL